MRNGDRPWKSAGTTQRSCPQRDANTVCRHRPFAKRENDRSEGIPDVAEPSPFQQEQGNQGCPNLDAESVLAGADEGLHSQILLEGFEEQLYVPALLVDCGDGGGTE